MKEGARRVRRLAVLAVAAWVAFALVGPANAAVGSRPVILSMTVSGSRPLPGSGVPVVVRVRVANARRCTFLRQYSAFSALYAYKTVSCSSGHADVVIPKIANGYGSPVQLSFEVRATGSGGVAHRLVKVAQAEASFSAPPAVKSNPPLPSPASTPSYLTSSNWAGYALPSYTSIFTSVAGTFTVPTLDCSSTPTGGMSSWVGIGGYGYPQGGSSGPLLQTGVESDCVGSGQANVAWWELVPSDPDHELTFSNFPVTAGDSITASVFQVADGSWWTRVDDTTTGVSGWMQTGGRWGVGTDAAGHFFSQGSAAQLSYGGGYTAEWIAEDYTEPDGQTLASLADFGTVSFTNLMTSASSWYLASNEGLALVDGSGGVVATPSAPGRDGSFTITYSG